METLNAITFRRSVRKYNDKPITDEEIQIILQAAMRAPSSFDFQPWYFVVLKSEEKRREFLTLTKNVYMDILPDLEARFPQHPEVISETRRFAQDLGGAPVILLAFLLRDDYLNPRSAMLSVAAAVQNALLAAQDLGIASCWSSAAERAGYGPRVRDRFAPGKADLIAVVTLGHTDAYPPMVRRKDGRAVIL